MTKLEQFLSYQSNELSGNKTSNEEILLQVIQEFRATVRKEAINGLKSPDNAKTASFKALLTECDVLRDDTLLKLGWKITDQSVTK